MLARLVVAVLLACSSQASALEYTDVYYDLAEPGWGMFLVQSDKTQFAAFFIYGADGKPTWYTAQLADDGNGSYTGPLFAITGTYFALPWQGYNIGPAGVASFTPTDRYHATLRYTVNGVGTITKPIERQTLTAYVLTGNYSGSMSGSVTGCLDPSGNDAAFRARYQLDVSQVGDTSSTLTFTFVDTAHDGLVCTVSGPLVHHGRLYQLVGNISCPLVGVSHAIAIDALHPTGQGIEGYLNGGFGGGCLASLHFAGVLNVNH